MLYNTFKRNTIYIENSELKELNEIAELSNEAISVCLEGVITPEEIPRYRKGYLKE